MGMADTAPTALTVHVSVGATVRVATVNGASPPSISSPPCAG
jgi:hypothetical protein